MLVPPFATVMFTINSPTLLPLVMLVPIVRDRHVSPKCLLGTDTFGTNRTDTQTHVALYIRMSEFSKPINQSMKFKMTVDI